jgi:hypothetical protein
VRHLRNLGSQFKISLPTDNGGYLGRECPAVDYKGYFKIVPGTGLADVNDCHCPYCGHAADQSEFHTPDQIGYAKSLVLRKVSDALIKDLKSLEFDTKPKGPFGIGLSIKVKPGRMQPVHLYREKALETHIECVGCTLKYAVFGVFAFCPDCGHHNSLQILDKNLDLLFKILDMASTAEAELADRLVENALEDCISAFDSFGREICWVYGKKSADPAKAEKVSFQNLQGAKQSLDALFNLDLSSGLSDEEWKAVVRGFQKRHLLSHTMGVVDEDYVRKSGDDQAMTGRKISIGVEEVRDLIRVVGKLALHVSSALRVHDVESIRGTDH